MPSSKAQMETTKAVQESKVGVKGVKNTMALVQGELTSQANIVSQRPAQDPRALHTESSTPVDVVEEEVSAYCRVDLIESLPESNADRRGGMYT